MNTYELPEYVTGEISIGPDGNVYIAAENSIIYALTSSLGLRWTFTTGYINNSPPTITNDEVILIGSQDGFLYALDSDGNEFWRFDTGSPIISSPIISSDGTIYVGSGGYIYSIGDGSNSIQDPVDHEDTGLIACCGVIYIPLTIVGIAGMVLTKRSKLS